MTEWQERFETFHVANPHVYSLFCKFAFELINAGRTVAAARMLIDRIRWETAISTEGDPWKINENFTPYYGRKFMEDHPQYGGLFRTRATRS